MKTSAAAGPNGTESPVESPVDVPALSAMDSSVYVMTCEGYVKIGYARDVLYRLGVHQVGNPFVVNVLGWVSFPTISEAQAAESRAHSRFQPWRVRGEWFRIDPEEALAFLSNGAFYERELRGVKRSWVTHRAVVRFA